MKRVVAELIDWIKAFIIALVLVTIISQFILIAKIDGHSMDPTLHDGQHVLTLRHLVQLKQDDIIGFNFEEADGTDTYHVKRIIGVPGDTVEVKEKQVIVNGKTVIDDGIAVCEDNVATSKQQYICSNATYKLNDDQYFVVGDNYEVSYDSRYHGPIDKDSILGKVIVEFPI